VEKRRVFLKHGKAYLPISEQQSLIVAEFSANLELALEVSSPVDEAN
jgi:DNA primase large subunit